MLKINIPKLNLLLFCGFLSFNPMQLTAQTEREIIYVGTYAERGSKGLYVFEFDREAEKLTEIQTIIDRESPTYLDIHPNGRYLYTGNRQGTAGKPKEGSVSTFKIDPSSGNLEILGSVSSGGEGPAHISVDPKARLIYVSHYASSVMSVFEIDRQYKAGNMIYDRQYTGTGPHPDRQKESHLHSVVADPSGEYIYASDLGTDKIHPFKIVEKNGKPELSPLADVQARPGSGPRHFLFHPKEDLAFSVEELSSTLASYRFDPSNGQLQLVDRKEMVFPSDNFKGTNTAADLQISPDGQFIYASNRGVDNIVIFQIDRNSGMMTYVASEPSGGAHPRSFAMDQKGEYLFVTNRDTDNLVFLKRDQKTGMLTPSGIEVKIPGAVVVKQLILNK